MNLRATAAKLISEVLDAHRSLNEVLPKYQLLYKKSEDKALLQALSFGVLRLFPRLNFMANQILKKPIKNKDSIILYLILLGIYQLYELRIPDFAAISETVEAARHLKKEYATGLINASLRAFQRRSQEIVSAAQNNKSIWFAHPDWLAHHIEQDWPNFAEIIFEANNSLPPMVLRINPKKIDKMKYLEQLASENINVKKEYAFPQNAVSLEKPSQVKELPGFKEGWFTIQDAASQCAAYFLDLKPNLKILDACSAPGGKATHILEMSEGCELIAVDISKDRTDKIKENLQRLQLSATVITQDIKQFAMKESHASFDRILLDAPCSATGVIRRHPDIKYLRMPNDITKLAAQQLELLQCLWPLLKPQGLLLYATCSILKEENHSVIKQFLELQEDAQLIPLEHSYHSELEFNQECGIMILPGQNDMDGFYYARLRKKT